MSSKLNAHSFAVRKIEKGEKDVKLKNEDKKKKDRGIVRSRIL